MLRKVVLALCVLALASGRLLADEIRGTIKNVDPSQDSVTVLMPGGEERTVQVGKTSPVYGMVTVGRRRRASTRIQQVGQGPLVLQPGMSVAMTTESREGLELVTQITENNVPYSGGGRSRRRR